MPNIIKSAFLNTKPFVIEYSHIVSAQIENTCDSLEQDNDMSSLESNLDVILEARKQADSILQEAEKKAEEILQEANIQAEKIKAQATNDGYSAGFENGKQEGYSQGYSQGQEEATQAIYDKMQAEIENAVKKAEKIIALAENEVNNNLMEAERTIIDIILETVNKVLADEVIKNPSVILPIVHQALEKVCNQDQIVIRVNPECYDVLLEKKSELQKIVMSGQPLVIKADSSLAMGDCVIDTQSGMVDARLSTKIEQLEKTVRNLLP